MKKWKKILMSLWIVALAVLIGCCVGEVQEARAENYNGYEYSVKDDGTVEITGYSGSETELEIPGEIEGKKVSNIGDFAFSGCSSLTQIIIPDSVTNIGDRAFLHCSSLTQVDIPTSVTNIGMYAFSNCSSLTQINIPASVTSIGDGSDASPFGGCSSLAKIIVDPSNSFYDSRENCNAIIETKTNYLISGCKNTVIPGSVTGIGDEAFRDCNSLMQISIPDSVTDIRRGAFSGCSALIEITVADGNLFYDSRENCNAIIQTKTNTLVAGCKNTVIPDSVVSIGACAFRSCIDLTQINIPNSVTSIGHLAFCDCCSLMQINVPDSVTSIGWSAFDSCSSLAEITVDDGNSIYDSRENCNAIIETKTNALVTGCKNTVIPDSVVSIGACAFSDCIDLTQISIPNSVTSIGSQAFWGCRSLVQINVPVSVTSINGSEVFWGCNNLAEITVAAGNSVYDSRENCNAIIETETNTLVTGCKNTVIPDSVTSIGYEAFYGCNSLTQINIPDGVNTIGNLAFCGCNSLMQINIPDGVNSIGDSAFYGCGSLTQVTLPESVNSIGTRAFWFCENLVIWTTRNSYADTYAKENGITVKYIGESEKPTSTPGQTPSAGLPTQQPPAQVQTVTQIQSVPGNSSVSPNQPSASTLAIRGGVKTTVGKKKLTLKWKKVADASGYEVQVSQKKNFKGAKKISVKKSKKSHTIKKLKSGKVYYVRIRAYTKVNGKKVYGKWVTAKKKVK